MPDLLFELGVEELPATFVKKAYGDLEAGIRSRLTEAGLSFTSSKSLGTPRRLIVSVEGIAERQEDSVKEMRGPSLSAAFDGEGKPTKALEGFCRGQGVSADNVRRDGEYVWVTKSVVGRSTAELLTEILPGAVKGLTFEKSMRWGNARMRFARPIRWMLAAFGGALVPFSIETVASSLTSRGHRFNHPEPFAASTFDELMNELLKRQVEPDPAERETTIRERTKIIASGTAQMDPKLVEENVFLTEWPSPLEGTFREEYLELPEGVLVTAMAKHEKMFPVRDAGGKITNRFIFVRNGGEENTVREGNAWVLNARFNDAKFFFDEDKRKSLNDFLGATSGMLFQEKLGSVRQRADRMSSLAAEIARETGADDAEVEMARKAGLYAKADLSTGLVSELPALQGYVGGEYARREGFEEAVAWAIATHYDLQKNLHIDGAAARTGVRVLMADQLDKLAGYLGLGILPSGSSDPMGLRRAATLLIEAALRWPAEFGGYASLLVKAVRLYEGHEFSVADIAVSLSDIFRSRYTSFFESSRYDTVEAALGFEDLNPQAVRARVAHIEALRGSEDLVQAAMRVLNLVSSAEKKGEAFSASLEGLTLDSASGEALRDAAGARSFGAQLREDLLSLPPAINAFFDESMIMAEDAKVRASRLSLLAYLRAQFSKAGDFSKLVSER